MKRIRHTKSSALFAQCWSKVAESDAMWRIYSQNGLGVRVGTTNKKLARETRGFIMLMVNESKI